MIAFITWLWGDAYGLADVFKLYAGVRRNYPRPFRFLVMTERERPKWHPLPDMERHAIKDPQLLEHRGCLVRLRMFDPGWQQNRQFLPGDRLVSLDLDNVITGELEPLFDRKESLVILQGGNAVNPCPYVGAAMMLQAFTNPAVWSDFSLEAVRAIPFHEFPDDQGWIHSKVPHAGAWPAGASSGIYCFCKPGWPGWPSKGSPHDLPQDARVVCFTGWRKPSKFSDIAWIRSNWRYP